jgi:hypothetical protein
MSSTYVMGENGTLSEARKYPVEPDGEARQAIWLLMMLIGWNGGVAPLYVGGEPRARVHLDCSVPLVGDEVVRRLARWHDRQLELGLPEAHANNGGPGVCTILWAWVESREQAWRAARRFRPLPSIVLKMGVSCRRLLIWPLEETAVHASVVAANKRIAYALHAPQKWAEPEKLRIPLPGSSLYVGRKKPGPVLVTRLTDATFLRSAVTGRLKDPPLPYMTRLRNGEIRR